MRINCHYSAEDKNTSIFFSAVKKRFYNYKDDWEELHNLYGGKYHVSENTRKGYLEPEVGKNDLIQFGWYLTSKQHNLQTEHYVNDKIMGFFPVDIDLNSNLEYPIVLSDNNQVAFLYQKDITNVLLNWDKYDWETISIPYFDRFGNEYYEKIYILNLFGERGIEIRATRFAELHKARKAREMAQEGILVGKNNSTFEKLLLLDRYELDNGPIWLWLYFGTDEYYSKLFEEDPHQYRGELTLGWYGEGDGFIWRRIGNEIEAWGEWETVSAEDPKVIEWVSVYRRYHLLEWHSQPIEYWRKSLKEEIIKRFNACRKAKGIIKCQS